MDFEITFNEDLSLTITDNTDYTALTVDETVLEITYPTIADNDLKELGLYTEKVASLGDNYTWVVADESILTTLIDGVYKFRFVSKNAGAEVSSTIKYVINDFKVYSCLLNKTDAILDKQCEDKWCEVGLVQSMLDIASRHAINTDYVEAQEIMDFLSDLCDGC